MYANNEELSRFKLDVISALAPEATAVLLDPEVSAAQAIAQHDIPNNTGLVVALESTGYTGNSTSRRAQIIPGWSVEKAKRMGACAVKLLVYYHPDSSTAKEIEDFTSKVIDDCRMHDLLLMLEPLSYSLDENRKLTSEEKHYVVIETAKRLSSLDIDILKVEFPLDVNDKDESGWMKACEEISEASAAPWILLSAAVEYETFVRQVGVACKAGASGIAVGRAVWQEAVMLNGADRIKFLSTTARERMSRLSSLCHALARPYTDFYTADAPYDWYKTY